MEVWNVKWGLKVKKHWNSRRRDTEKKGNFVELYNTIEKYLKQMY